MLRSHVRTVIHRTLYLVVGVISLADQTHTSGLRYLCCCSVAHAYDYKGRIWLDNIAYRSEDEVWYQIERSPLFISLIKELVSIPRQHVITANLLVGDGWQKQIYMLESHTQQKRKNRTN
jgi:hypothetical protein